MAWYWEALVALATFVIGWFFARCFEPLKRLKNFLATEVGAKLAMAAVLVAEVLWSHLDGEEQSEDACKRLADWLAQYGIVKTPEEIEALIQEAYQILKGIFGDYWDVLKLCLGS